MVVAEEVAPNEPARIPKRDQHFRHLRTKCLVRLRRPQIEPTLRRSNTKLTDELSELGVRDLTGSWRLVAGISRRQCRRDREVRNRRSEGIECFQENATTLNRGAEGEEVTVRMIIPTAADE
jgi:hypothetical protein